MNRAIWMVLALGGCGSITPYTFDPDTDKAGDTDPTSVDTDGTNPDDTDITWTDSDAGSTDTDEPPGPVGTSDDPFIVEVVDGTAAPNLRYVEIYNPHTQAVDITGWKLNHLPEGVGANTETFVFPSVMLASGRTYVVCYDQGAAAFTNAFPGKTCDATSPRVKGDGNDPYTLTDAGGSFKDLYGAFNGDGTGTAWEYTDSVAKRKSTVGAGSSTWRASEWTITSGQGAANPGDRN